MRVAIQTTLSAPWPIVGLLDGDENGAITHTSRSLVAQQPRRSPLFTTLRRQRGLPGSKRLSRSGRRQLASAALGNRASPRPGQTNRSLLWALETPGRAAQQPVAAHWRARWHSHPPDLSVSNMGRCSASPLRRSVRLLVAVLAATTPRRLRFLAWAWESGAISSSGLSGFRWQQPMERVCRRLSDRSVVWPSHTPLPRTSEDSGSGLSIRSLGLAANTSWPFACTAAVRDASERLYLLLRVLA